MKPEQQLKDRQVLDALGGVMDPELGKDLVSLGMVERLKIEGGAVSFDLVLTTPACPLKKQIEESCREAVLRVPGVKEVRINVTSRMKGHYSGHGQVNLLPTVKNTIAVASGKGGVGKSTVSVNLAVALAQSEARVGLMDCDIYGPSIPLMMGVEEQPSIRDEKLIPLERYGVRMMSLGFLLDKDTPVIWRGPLVVKALQQMLQDVDWDELDYLVMDMPPGTGDVPLTVSQSVPLTGAVIVTTPQDVALADASKGTAMFNKVGVPVLGIVENMSFFECPHCGKRTDIFRHGGGSRESERLGVPFLGEIPIDAEVAEGGDKGKPVVAGRPGSAASQAFLGIAGIVASSISVTYHKAEAVVQEKGQKLDG
jgi:ATP-binding protein involved in chromosome partitioning